MYPSSCGPSPARLLPSRGEAGAICSGLRGGGGGYICGIKWEGRRRYTCQREGGWLREEAVWAEEEKERGDAEGQNGDGADMMNPMAAMEGMKVRSR